MVPPRAPVDGWWTDGRRFPLKLPTRILIHCWFAFQLQPRRDNMNRRNFLKAAGSVAAAPFFSATGM